MSRIKRSILLNASEVLATLDGRKTQHRIPVNPQPGDGGLQLADVWEERTGSRCPRAFNSPFGGPGDVLWVKETWRTTKDQDHLKPRECCHAISIQYKADMGSQFPGETPQEWGKWRPSVFMMLPFSRVRLLVKRVWVERVRDLSETDAKAEGSDPCESWKRSYQYRDGFSDRWNSAYGKKGLGTSTNPWIWASEFEVLP